MTKDNLDLMEAMDSLRSNRESIPWPQRRALAQRICRTLAESVPDQIHIDLLELLASDPQPHVRKDVAEALVHLPENEFTRIASVLSDDNSFFVRKAVDRAVSRKRKGAKAARQAGRKLVRSRDQYGQIEKRHGKSAAERAKKANDEAFEDLVGQTTHNMRAIMSPIKTAISTLSHQIESGRPDAAFCGEKLSMMKNRIELLERFVNDMREYSRAAVAERHREWISAIVKDALQMVHDYLRESGYDITGIDLQVNIPDRAQASVARQQVMMMLFHLIANAYESFLLGPGSVPDPQIQLEITQTGDGSLEIRVRDNGPGIHPETLDLLRQFVPGHTTKKNKGTGFGLPTAQRYAEAHGGALWIDSVEGEGAEITVAIPMDTEDEL